MTEIEPEYRAARAALIAAIEALREHRAAVIIAGAQAVYLHTGSLDLGVAPFTTDADFAVDANELSAEPALEAAMLAANFYLATEPGIWFGDFEIDGMTYSIPVDLIVPEAVAPPGGRRGARLPHHGKRAARRASGLEVALVDHAPMTIEPLSPGTDAVRANVAGPAALLVAKAYKIADRLEAKRPDRMKDKDASDVFRLMQACDAGDVATALIMALDSPASSTAERGLELLSDQFGRRGRPGIAAASSALRLSMPEARVVAVCTGFMADLTARLEAPARST